MSIKRFKAEKTANGKLATIDVTSLTSTDLDELRKIGFSSLVPTKLNLASKPFIIGGLGCETTITTAKVFSSNREADAFAKGIGLPIDCVCYLYDLDRICQAFSIAQEIWFGKSNAADDRDISKTRYSTVDKKSAATGPKHAYDPKLGRQVVAPARAGAERELMGARLAGEYSRMLDAQLQDLIEQRAALENKITSLQQRITAMSEYKETTLDKHPGVNRDYF